MAAKLNTPPSEPMSAITAKKAAALVDAINQAHSYILKLEALLTNTYSESGPTFRNMATEFQDSYLWACSDLSTDIKTALEKSFEVQP